MAVRFCYLAVLNLRVVCTMDVRSPFVSVVLIDSSTENPAYVLVLSIQAVHGVPLATTYCTVLQS